MKLVWGGIEANQLAISILCNSRLYRDYGEPTSLCLVNSGTVTYIVFISAALLMVSVDVHTLWFLELDGRNYGSLTDCVVLRSIPRLSSN